MSYIKFIVLCCIVFLPATRGATSPHSPEMEQKQKTSINPYNDLSISDVQKMFDKDRKYLMSLGYRPFHDGQLAEKGCGLSSVKGKRRTMEDEIMIIPGDTIQTAHLDDGHGGNNASIFAINRRAPMIHLLFSKKLKKLHNLARPGTSKWLEQINYIAESALTESFESTDKLFYEVRKRFPTSKEKKKKPHLTLWGTDGSECALLRDQSGTTALSAILYKNIIWVANAGDSRAVIGTSQGDVIEMSRDHTIKDPEERERIIKILSQFVPVRTVDSNPVAYYTNGKRTIKFFEGRYLYSITEGTALSGPSRGIGDHDFLDIVIPCPEIRRRVLTVDDAFLIMACDGVWNFMSNKAAVDCVGAFLKEHPGGVMGAAAALKDLAMKSKSNDNVSVVVIDLSGRSEAFSE